VDGFGEEASVALSNDCRLFERVASSQLVPLKLQNASPLMMLVFRAPTTCPIVE
jgi:hypothetical protein